MSNTNRVALTQGDGWRVSTVYLWNDNDDTPVYESMAFLGESFDDLASVRWSSEELARNGHEAMVEMMKINGHALISKWRSGQ